MHLHISISIWLIVRLLEVIILLLHVTRNQKSCIQKMVTVTKSASFIRILDFGKGRWYAWLRVSYNNILYLSDLSELTFYWNIFNYIYYLACDHGYILIFIIRNDTLSGAILARSHRSVFLRYIFVLWCSDIAAWALFLCTFLRKWIWSLCRQIYSDYQLIIFSELVKCPLCVSKWVI